MGLTPNGKTTAFVEGARTVRAASKHGAETLVYIALSLSAVAALAYTGAGPVWIVATAMGAAIGYVPYKYFSELMSDLTILRRKKNGVEEIIQERGLKGILRKWFKVNK